MAKRLDFDFAFKYKESYYWTWNKMWRNCFNISFGQQKNSAEFRCRSRWENAQTGMEIFAITLLVRVAEKN